MIKWMRKVLLSGCIPSVICFFFTIKNELFNIIKLAAESIN